LSEKNMLDEQFTHILRKMKRLETENAEMKESYELTDKVGKRQLEKLRECWKNLETEKEALELQMQSTRSFSVRN